MVPLCKMKCECTFSVFKVLFQLQFDLFGQNFAQNCEFAVIKLRAFVSMFLANEEHSRIHGLSSACCMCKGIN